MGVEQATSIDRMLPSMLEFQLEPGQEVIRGSIWDAGPTPLVLIHDVGDSFDVDSWLDLPGILHRNGYTVCAIDLPGHGLSDGTFSVQSGRMAVARVLSEMGTRTGHSAAIVVAGKALELVPDESSTHVLPRAVIAFSPPVVLEGHPTVPKLAFVGATNSLARDRADQFLRRSRGWTMVSSYGTSEQGHELLESPHAENIVGQILAFLASYRTQVRPPKRPGPRM